MSIINFQIISLLKIGINISKLRDLVNLIQLIGTNEEMPIKHENIKKIIINTLSVFD